MKKKIEMALALLVVLYFSCERLTQPRLGGDAFTLQEAATLVTESYLRLHAGQVVSGSTLRVYRNGEMLLQKPYTEADSIVYDSTLAPAHTYTYRAELWSGNRQLARSNAVTVTTLDTTSHDFEWEIIEFHSPYGSGALYDVAIINENDIWAVGEIYSDSNQTWLPYNAVHWDGEKWELKRINYKGSPWPITAIYAFSPNDIWFEAFVKWDGTNFIEMPIPDILIGYGINKIWGNSSKDFYVIGNRGFIAHYDGSSWRRIELPGIHEFILTDIWGVHDEFTGKDRIYVTASSDPFAASPVGRKILRIKGDKIEEVNVSGLPDYLTSIWFNNWRYYAGTLGGVYINSGLLGQWDWVDTLSYYGIGRIRGNENNDVFVGGAFGMCAHYNGMSWRIYTGRELPWIYGTYTGLAVAGNIVVLAGDQGNDAIIVVGKRF